MVKTFLETVNKFSKKKIIKFGRSGAAFKNCFLTRQLLIPGMLNLQYF